MSSAPAPLAGISARPGIASLAAREWDLVVIGGGITGAAVFREASRRGLRTLLVEQGDFASGTSSKSSKLVHGGLHYLARGQLRLALESIRERSRLVAERPEFVAPLDFSILQSPEGEGPGALKVRTLVTAYRLLSGGGKRDRRVPRGGRWGDPRSVARYTDAQTDDAALVIRVLREGVDAGGEALNYVRVCDLGRDGEGCVVGVRLRDAETGASGVVRAGIVVNATGPWAGSVAGPSLTTPTVRGVKGSHLVIPSARLPLRRAVVALRPGSSEYVCFIPWQGVVLVGSTSIDVGPLEDAEPSISPEEFTRLLGDVNRTFPRSRISASDVQSTFSGVRPIVDTKTTDPAMASREEAIWEAEGMISVTGGKLTTHRAMAARVLKRCLPRLPHRNRGPAELPAAVGAEPMKRGRRESLTEIAEMEGVRHLDDLLLRRLRWGITKPDGGLGSLRFLRSAVEPVLGWDSPRWHREVERYEEILNRYYRTPDSVSGSNRRVPETKREAPVVAARSVLAALVLLLCGGAAGDLLGQSQNDRPGRQVMGFPFVNYNADEGVGYGVLGVILWPGGPSQAAAREPFRLRIDPALLLTTGGRREFALYADAPALGGSPWRGVADAVFERQLSVPYYGEGNASEYDPALEEAEEGYYRFGRRGWRVQMSLRRPLGVRELQGLVGVEGAGTVVDPIPGEGRTSLLAEELGTGEPLAAIQSRSVRGGIIWDSRNHETVPTDGIWAEALVQQHFEALGGSTSFRRWTTAVRGYRYLTGGITLAGRVLFQETHGDVPVHERLRIQSSHKAAEGLGGARTLRGVPQNRFVGRSLAVVNAEVRWEGGPRRPFGLRVLPGLVGFVDAGRVWSDGLPSGGELTSDLHRGIGAGLRLRAGEHFLISADFGHSSHTSLALYLGVGHLF